MLPVHLVPLIGAVSHPISVTFHLQGAEVCAEVDVLAVFHVVVVPAEEERVLVDCDDSAVFCAFGVVFALFFGFVDPVPRLEEAFGGFVEVVGSRHEVHLVDRGHRFETLG